MKRMRLLAYLVYVYAVPEAHRFDGGFTIPRAIFRRLWALSQREARADVVADAFGDEHPPADLDDAE